jgi:hypothetical protein
VSLIAAPTDRNSRKPVFTIRRLRPGLVSVARAESNAFGNLDEVGTITEAVRMVCHHARYWPAETRADA